MTNPSSSTSRGEFCMNGNTHTFSGEKEKESDTSWVSDMETNGTGATYVRL